MTQSQRDLEPIDPDTARELYLDHKASECADVTVRSHGYRLQYFIRWCGHEGIDNLNDLTGRDLHEYSLWRKEESDLNKVSMRTQMCTLRVFLQWCGSIEAVPQDLYDKVLVPSVTGEENQRNELLEAERAEEILDHLATYHYASFDHLLMALLWETGMRIGAANSLDLDDVNFEESSLQVVHRPETGTTLKNGTGGERLVAITDALRELIEDYVEVTRVDTTEDSGRRPLLAGQCGRISRTTMRRHVYKLTAPCYLGQECPDCAGKEPAKCGESVSPHAIRRGSITHYLSEDVPVQIVGDRMDVSRKIIEKHYDRRTEEVKLEQRRGYLDNI